MNGLICVQGGREFTDECREMDAAWLELADRRRTCVAPLASAAGVQYRTAASTGAEYLRSLGVDDIWMAPEPDHAVDGAVRAIVDADIVVIPGGSLTRPGPPTRGGHRGRRSAARTPRRGACWWARAPVPWSSPT